jgi:hypothetical protein
MEKYFPNSVRNPKKNGESIIRRYAMAKIALGFWPAALLYCQTWASKPLTKEGSSVWLVMGFFDFTVRKVRSGVLRLLKCLHVQHHNSLESAS